MPNQLSIDRIKSLAGSHQKPLLALKAYTVFILDHLVENDYLEYVVDHVLHCNVLVLQTKEEIECVRDYTHIALDLLLSIIGIEFDKKLLSLEIVELILRSIQGGKLEGTSVEILMLLYITLNNWACCEVRSGSTTLGYSLFRLCPILCEILRSTSTLLEDTNLNFALVNNECAHQLMMCNFPEVEQLLINVLGLSSGVEYLLPSGHLAIPDVQDLLGSGQTHEVVLLKGLACYNMAITQEFQHCEEATGWYTVVIEVLELLTDGITLFDDLSDVLKMILSVKERLLKYVQETKQRLLQDLGSRVENTSRRRQKGAPGSRIGLRQGKRLTSQIDKNLIAVSAPAISADLRSSIRRSGLPTMILELLSMKEFFDILCPGFTAGLDSCTDVFISPLCDCIPSEGRVVGVLVCTKTPVQCAIEQDKMLSQGIRESKSVWVLRRQISDLSLRREPVNISSKLIDIHDRNVFPRVSSPSPPSLSEVEKSCTQLSSVSRLLDKRLNVLIKCERVFEDRWSATEMILKALVAFYVPQELLKLKEEFIVNQRVQALHKDRCARILTAFFRRILTEKKLSLSKSGEWYRKFRENEAAITLQSYVRRWIAIQRRKELEFVKKRMICRITRVQSLFRGRKTRRMYFELLKEQQIAKSAALERAAMHFAATQIQRTYRGHSTRLAVWRYLGMHHYATLHHLHDSRQYYATLIQSWVRGMLLRKIYGKQVYAKRCSARNRYRTALLEKSCILIQRCFRGYRARGRIIRLFSSCSNGRPKNTPAIDRLQDDEVEEKIQSVFYTAAIIIQRSWRLYHDKKHVRELMEKRKIMTLSRQKENHKPFSINEWIF
ncbi:unnamed protein product [Phytomonas sp. Hart1]|nr:unnamed protein product [Phytomonas sp. Hart1]|eukprot:CCW65971.1 unnamed protein product [Phytomonas sp. isolate Hart1]